ncbi:hypothetical protein OUZ56_027080 [Daphnia magna]|uniref:Uncharacterized protein n=1 Tax=Daphnia magna TaxID=35525 RepID=A0ABQ9ZP04_9CRUS|nr:hypothetical protein OUZ56_027080 [Daphnia magna]
MNLLWGSASNGPRKMQPPLGRGAVGRSQGPILRYRALISAPARYHLLQPTFETKRVDQVSIETNVGLSIEAKKKKRERKEEEKVGDDEQGQEILPYRETKIKGGILEQQMVFICLNAQSTSREKKENIRTRYVVAARKTSYLRAYLLSLMRRLPTYVFLYTVHV